MTHNHNYSTPDEGTPDWHIPLNNNFESLDTDIEIRDLESSLAEYAPKAGAKFLATDTETVYVGDGQQWNQLRSRGQNPAFGSVRTRRLSTMAFAEAYSGADLSARVENALDDLPNGQGRVVVTPRADGQPWSWTRTLSRDVVDEGVEIDVVQNTRIEVDVDGWAMDFTGGAEAWNDPIDTVKISGGYWEFADAADPSGWLRLTDIYGSDVSPTAVINCQNASEDAIGVQVRNVTHFSEGTYLHHFQLREVNVGVDHAPASVTGGSGSDSFHNERMDHVHVDGCLNVGIRFQGGAQLAASSFTDVGVWPAADGVVAWELDCEPDGCAIQRPKVEGNVANLTAFKITNTAFKPMRVYDPMCTGVDTKVDTPGNGEYLVIYNEENEANIVRDRGFDRTELRIGSDGVYVDGSKVQTN